MFNTNHTYNYIITETNTFSSLDPLDGDQTHNLPVQRMIYATPVEVSEKGTLTSAVLDHFAFDEKTNTVEWTVQQGIKYSDRSNMTADDVAFAVARMIYKRPKFPVIEDIQGIENWLKTEYPLETLPTGIEVKGSTVKIYFDKKVDHPLFRFSLEIFSIIPKKCVDLKTNKVICADVPASGHYAIKEKSNQKITFSLRDTSPLKKWVPSEINFLYRANHEALKIRNHDINIIQANEINWQKDQQEVLRTNFKIKYMPSSRISLLLLNSNVGAFKDRNCRLVYADIFRIAFGKVFSDTYKSESSLFTEVIAGYLSSEELRKKTFDGLSQDAKEKCLANLKKNPPLFAISMKSPNALFYKTVMESYRLLGIENLKPLELSENESESKKFIDGEISMTNGNTGFWAMDPAGDVQMLLTPNMHKILQQVSNDDTVQKLIKNLKSSENKKEAYEKLNEYIYADAKFNVFSHIRRFYASDSIDNIAELPTSITSPAPWQVFRMK